MRRHDLSSTRQGIHREHVGDTEEVRRLHSIRPVGQKIGSAEEVFVNLEGEPEYIRVRIGLFGMKSVLIPVQFVETEEEQSTLTLQ